MDKSHCQSFVQETVRYLRWDLGLSRWEIDITYEALEGARGDVTAGWPYYQAHIRIDPDWHDSEVELFETLRHELLHLVIKPVEVYARMVRDMIDGAHEDSNDTAYQFAQEEMINQLDWMFSHMKLTPKKHLERIRRDAKRGR